MDKEKMMGNYLKKWSQSPQSKFDDWLIKKLGDTKIDNVGEWCTFQFLSLTYHAFYMCTHIEVMDKEYNAKAILEMLEENSTFISKMPLCREGIVGEWFAECWQLKEDVENNLEQFLLHSERKELYTKSILNMKSYCERHKEDYEEWRIELNKYMNGEKKELLLGLGIVIGIWLLCFSMIGYRQQSVKQSETEILEEQESFDDSSLENLDVEQILARKL